MADVKQMVTGFNHNVKHRGKPFHVQTEDSGVANPQITTHLFVGGNIIASKKTSYADRVGAPNLPQVVRELMEEQHKDVLRNLVNGRYDDRDEALSAKARAYQPGQLAEPGRVANASRAAPGPAERPAQRPAAARPPGAAPNLTPPPVLSRHAAPPPLPPHGRPPALAPDEPAIDLDARFGDEGASEKSLDEVILSYLAEPPRPKK
jgi:hypothetical protein